MIGSSDLKRETLVEWVIGASARNKFLVIIFAAFAVAAGIMGCCTLLWMPFRIFPMCR